MHNNRNIDEQLNQYSYCQLINTYSISFQKNYQYPHLLYYYFFLTAFIDFWPLVGILTLSLIWSCL